MNTHTKSRGFAVLGLFLAGIAEIELNAETGWTPVHELPPYVVQGDQPNGWWTPEDEERLLAPPSVGRSSTFVDAEALLRRGVTEVGDFVGAFPGLVRQARFGVMTVPTVRGDAAETLFNGQRRGDNLFGMPLSFTPVSGMELINGAGFLATGPGKRSGGLMNMVTLGAAPREARGETVLRLGTWVPGDQSFSTLEARARINLPIGTKHALAIAIGARDNATYFHRNGGRDDQTDLYLSWRRSGERGQLDLIAYFQDSSRPQPLGVNRPWQGLITVGLYITGEVDPVVGVGDPPGLFDPGIADPGLLTAGPTDLTKIDRDRVLMSQGDRGEGSLALFQALGRVELASGSTLAHGLLVERVFREKLNQFYYAEDVEQLTVDSLTRLSGQWPVGTGTLEWELGLHLRLEERDNRANYWNEFAYAWDISENRRFNALERFPGVIAPGPLLGQGSRPWYVPSSLFSTPESTDSELRQAGVYAEAAHVIGNGWRVGLGGRVDRLEAAAREPGDLGGTLADAASVGIASGSATVMHEGSRHAIYLTYADFGGVAGNTVGDGINLYGESGLHEADLDNRFQLLELGVRADLAAGWALRGALFSQRRQRVEFFGRNTIQTDGVELGMDWRPSRDTHVGWTAHYIDARYRSGAPAEFGGGSVWNVFAPGTGPTGDGNGLGYTRGFFLNSVSPGDHRLPGLSRWQIGFQLDHRLTPRWDVVVHGWVQGPQSGNLAGEFTIPRQMEWNASLGYRVQSWEARIGVHNLLDAENWIHNGDTYFDQLLISRNLPRRLELWLHRRW
jgi:hypothetical protein